MRYNIPDIVQSTFEFDDLYHQPELRSSILSLLNPSEDKIQITRDLLFKAELPWPIDHHIKIRLELIVDILKSV